MNRLRNIILLALLIAISLPASAQVNILRGTVVSIADGDTITIVDDNNRQYRIRLQGIDAPESSQSFGTASSENMTKLVFNKLVSVEWNKHDRYGRIVGNVLIDGQDAGLHQVKAGLAWHYKQYQNEQSANDRLAYAEAELEARANRWGLWADSSPTPPWTYRHGGAPNPISATVVPNPPKAVLPNTSEPVVLNTPKQSTHVYIRGPRGGCYYLRGRKIYVDHSFCN